MKVAAVQAAPVFLDLGASLDKALSLIAAAAGQGARLVVFPEAFLPAWPAWVDEVLPGADAAWHLRLLDQSVVVPGPVTDRLGAAARAAGVHRRVSGLMMCLALTAPQNGLTPAQ